MLRNLKSFFGFIVHAMDGDVGKVDDFYFDDEKWTIRYFIVQDGNWLTGRRVLVSPSAFEKSDGLTRVIPVKLTKDLVKSSPEVDLAKPLTREQEKELHQHYGWPAYWSALGMSGFVPAGIGLDPQASAISEIQAGKTNELREREEAGKHLHSAKDVIGYYLSALDGDIGHIEDFLVDDQGWVIRYAVVDTRNWLPGRKVVIAPQWIKDFLWEESKAVVNLKKIRIEQSPEYHPTAPIGRAYEEELYAHYDQERYWGSEWDRAA